MPLDEHQEQLLVSLLARLLPSPEFDDTTRAKVLTDLKSRTGEEPASFAQQLPLWLKWLENEAFCVFCDHWLNLHDSTKDEVLDRIESDNLRTGSDEVDPIGFYQTLLGTIEQLITRD